MNVLILMPQGEQRGGAEMLLLRLLEHTVGGDITWTVAFFEPGPLVGRAAAHGWACPVIPTGRLRQPKRFGSAVARLARLARQCDADLIFGWSGKAQLYGGVVSLLTGIPAAWYQHGIPAGRHRHVIDRIATLLPAAAIFTVSETSRTAQRRLWPKRPTQLVYPCADLDAFAPSRLPSSSKMRVRLGLPDAGPLVGIVGRLQHWKGIHTLVQAMPVLLARHPDTHCVIVGGRHNLEPEYADWIQTLIRENDLQDVVTVTGYQPNVSEWMQAMDVVVHASDTEPFGIVIVEAMALGKAIVAGSEGGGSEIVTEGVNGKLAPFGAPEILADQILAYLDAPSLRAEMGRAAAIRAQDFSAPVYATAFTDAIRTVCSSPTFSLA